MKYITKLKLATVHQLCNFNDKSTEYMLQLMQDVCKIDLNVCLNYLQLPNEQHELLFKELTELQDIIINLIENE